MGWFFAGMLTLALCALVAAIIYGFIVPLKVHFRAVLTPVVGSGQSAAQSAAQSTTRSAVKSPVPGTEPNLGQPQDAPPFIGLALSGGGARAALFAAAGMKALHARGLLDEVTHVSSVSGGGFAASYWALNPLPLVGGADAYFAKMQTVLAHDFFWDVQMRQFREPARAFSPSRRLVSLQDALDSPEFLRGATFHDVPAARTFFFNAVSYDTGQRFVFSNGTLPPPDASTPAILPAALRALSFSDANGLRCTPDAVPLSLAVATSAAFPPYLGPTTLQIENNQGGGTEYWHLGDGGVVENSGVETLREAIYALGENQRAKIYVFNAGQRLDSVLSKKSHDISIWSRDVTRLVDVLLEYANAHRETMFDALDRRHGTEVEIIEFDYLEVVELVNSQSPPDARWLSWEGWIDATPADKAASKTPADHLAKIPTALKITRCNRELITAAAEYLVNHKINVAHRTG